MSADVASAAESQLEDAWNTFESGAQPALTAPDCSSS
jgi:hypothetical protein